MFLVVDLLLFRNLCEGRVLCVSTPEGCFTDRMLSIGAGAGGAVAFESWLLFFWSLAWFFFFPFLLLVRERVVLGCVLETAHAL